MKIVGYILLALGLITAFGNLTGGGLRYRGGNGRLIFALAVAGLGAWLAFGQAQS